MTPLVVSDALDGASAWVDAADVTTALALLLAPLSVSVLPVFLMRLPPAPLSAPEYVWNSTFVAELGG